MPSPSPSPATAGCGQALAIPSYFYPGALWTQAKQARAKIMVINPNSGPDAPDAYTQQAYINTVLDMVAAGEPRGHNPWLPMVLLGYGAARHNMQVYLLHGGHHTAATCLLYSVSV